MTLWKFDGARNRKRFLGRVKIALDSLYRMPLDGRAGFVNTEMLSQSFVFILRKKGWVGGVTKKKGRGLNFHPFLEKKSLLADDFSLFLGDIFL